MAGPSGGTGRPSGGAWGAASGLSFGRTRLAALSPGPARCRRLRGTGARRARGSPLRSLSPRKHESSSALG